MPKRTGTSPIDASCNEMKTGTMHLRANRLTIGVFPWAAALAVLLLMAGCSGVGWGSGTGTAKGTGVASGTGTATDSKGHTVSGTSTVVGTGTVSGTGTVAGSGTATEGTATPELPSGVLVAVGLIPLLVAYALWRRRALGKA